MMTIEYPRRYLKNRRQLMVQCFVSALVVLPPLVWRLARERAVVSMALGGLALAAFTLSYRGMRFLAAQEALHPQPTPEMTFVFMLVAVYPLAMSTFLLILLAEM